MCKQNIVDSRLKAPQSFRVLVFSVNAVMSSFYAVNKHTAKIPPLSIHHTSINHSPSPIFTSDQYQHFAIHHTCSSHKNNRALGYTATIITMTTRHCHNKHTTVTTNTSSSTTHCHHYQLSNSNKMTFQSKCKRKKKYKSPWTLFYQQKFLLTSNGVI